MSAPFNPYTILFLTKDNRVNNNKMISLFLFTTPKMLLKFRIIETLFSFLSARQKTPYFLTEGFEKLSGDAITIFGKNHIRI